MTSPDSPVAVDTGLAVKAEGLAKAFGSTVALAPLDLEIKAGEFLSVLGPSGCGKSTLMRLLAGLDHPDVGRLWLAGEDVTAASAFQRDVALVFQLFTLYPHMSVLDNVTFPLRAQGMARAEADGLARFWLERLDVGHLAALRPRGLSGGDRQKIAMARALVRRAKLFLFDEPLSALDPGARETLWEWVRKEITDRGATSLLVTHDQAEAMALGDRLAVMRQGRLEQIDKPEVVYDRPANLFVADFVGMPGMNLLPAHRSGEWVQIQGMPLRVRITESPAGRLVPQSGETACVLGIRPEWVAIIEGGAPLPVEHTASLGPANLLEMRLGDKPLRCWLPAGVKKMRGETAALQVMPSACRFFDAQSGELLPWRALEAVCHVGS